MNTINKNNVVEIDLMKNVSGTTTSSEGLALFLIMNKAIKAGKSIRLSLANSTPLSSSFLNATFGELYDNYGHSTITKKIVLINYLSSHAISIKKYLQKLDKLVK